jgi:hypothetical protein
VGAATGAVIGAAAAGIGTPPLSKTEPLLIALPWIVRKIEVQKKSAAAPPVKRVKKLAPPELPKTVWLDPPKEALISAPLPD